MSNQNQIVVPGWLRISKVIAYLLYVWVIIGVVSLVLRVFLLLFSANPNTSFVDFVYRVSADYLEPFRGIFPAKTVGETGYLDVAALFAVIVYLFIMWGFASLVSYIQFKIDQSVRDQEKELAQLKAEKAAAANRQQIAVKKAPAKRV